MKHLYRLNRILVGISFVFGFLGLIIFAILVVLFVFPEYEFDSRIFIVYSSVFFPFIGILIATCIFIYKYSFRLRDKTSISIRINERRFNNIISIFKYSN